MSWNPIGRSLGQKDYRSTYVNTETGEMLSRRQYDKRYGLLAKQGYKGFEQKASIREKAGLKGVRLPNIFSITGSRDYQHAKSKHTYIKTKASLMGETVSAMLGQKGMRQTTVSVVVKDKKTGQRKQSRVYKPTSKNIGGTLGNAASAVAAEYDFDVDEDPNGDYDVELIWSEGL